MPRQEAWGSAGPHITCARWEGLQGEGLQPGGRGPHRRAQSALMRGAAGSLPAKWERSPLLVPRVDLGQPLDFGLALGVLSELSFGSTSPTSGLPLLCASVSPTMH